MSVRAMTWVWEHQLPPSAKLVLLALADHSDDRGRCWPSIAGVARKCGTSESTVRRALKLAAQAGLLDRQRRYDADGRQRSTLYHLRLEGLVGLEGGVSKCDPRVPRCQQIGRQHDAVEAISMPPLESSEEPSEESSSACAGTRRVRHDDDSRYAQDDADPLELDAALIERVAAADAAGRVRKLTPYLVGTLRRAGISTDEVTVDCYATAVRAQRTTLARQPRRYSPQLLATAKRAGVDPAGRHPQVVQAEIDSVMATAPPVTA